MAAATGRPGGLPVEASTAYIIGWGAVGLGMGLIYLDLLNRGVAGDHRDLPEAEAPTVVILGETIPTAIVMTFTAGLLALSAGNAMWVFLALAVLALALPALIRRSATDC